MQRSLFDDGNLGRIGYQKALKNFNLDDAIKNIEAWQKTLDAPADIDKKRTALLELQKIMCENTQENLIQIRSGYKESDFLFALGNEFSLLHEGLNKALEKYLNADEFEFLNEILHPAEIWLETAQYDLAVKSVDKYISEYSENAFLRQLQALAYLRTENEKEAFTAATKAHFLDPLICRPQFILPGTFLKKFEFLHYKTGQINIALLRLPFALWLDGKTYIDLKANTFEKLLEKQVQKNEKSAFLNAELNQMQFNHLLYLAEVERLNNPRGVETDKLKELRKKLKALNEDSFNAYISALRAFRNI